MDKASGLVPIELDRPRNLKWSFQCIRLIESETGINLRRPSPEDIERFSNPTVTLLAVMLCGALRHEDKRITVDQAGDLLLQYGAQKIVDPLMTVYVAGITQILADREATAGPPISPIGSTSGPSADST